MGGNQSTAGTATEGVDVTRSKYKREQNPKFQGGFADVYLCTSQYGPDRGVTYVMKIARNAMVKEVDLAQRELDILMQLRHSNVVKYVEYFRENSLLCLVMEYCVKGNLEEYVLNHQPIGNQQIWDWFIQLGLGLEYIHSAKVMHRDLRPKNIFLTQDLTLKIGDFGLAKVCAHSAAISQSHLGQTELAYCSPEMLDTDKCSKKCDVWALGCTLYFVITGKKTFGANTLGRTTKLIGDNKYDPIPLSKTEELRELTSWLLTFDMEKRPSIREVMQDDLVRNAAPIESCLRNTYKLTVNGDTLEEENGGAYVFDRHSNPYDDEIRYQGVATHVTEYIYRRMEEMKLQRQPVPIESKGSIGEGTVIFVSPDWMSRDHMLVLVPGGNMVKAGQWARRVIVNKSIRVGSQLPYIEKALKKGYAVISLNINDNRPNVEGCTSANDHGLYVWEHFIKHSGAVKIAIVSHSAGGNVVSALYEKYEMDFKKRVFANAFTGSDPIHMPKNEYTQAVTNSWIKTNPVKTLGTVLPANGGLGRVSAGTSEHSETPDAACEDIFKFIVKHFNRDHPEDRSY